MTNLIPIGWNNGKPQRLENGEKLSSDFIELPDVEGVLSAADLTALAAVDTSGFTNRVALVTDIGLYRWKSGQELPADGFTVLNSTYTGQWILEPYSPGPDPDTMLEIASNLRRQIRDLQEQVAGLQATAGAGYKRYRFSFTLSGYTIGANSVSRQAFICEEPNVSFDRETSIVSVYPTNTPTSNLIIGYPTFQVPNVVVIPIANVTGASVNFLGGEWIVTIFKEIENG